MQIPGLLCYNKPEEIWKFFYKSIHQRLTAILRLYSERKGDRYEYDSGYYCTGTGDRIWRICDQLSLFKKETGAQLCRLCR